MFKSIALYAVAAGAIFSAGMFYQMSRQGEAVIKDQQKQSEGVSKLHKGELKDTKVLVKTIYKLRKNTTKCGKTNMRPIDIEAQR